MFYIQKTITITGQQIESVVRPVWVDEHLGQVVEVRATNDPEYLAWVAEGNTAEEWQPDGE